MKQSIVIKNAAIVFVILLLSPILVAVGAFLLAWGVVESIDRGWVVGLPFGVAVVLILWVLIRYALILIMNLIGVEK